MNRQEYIDKIIKYSARFLEEVKLYNSLNLYNINIHAENFFIPVLNLIYNVDLENLNSTKKRNFPAIDLADFEKKVAFQVTSSDSFEKILSTIKNFHSHKLYNNFNILYIIIIGDKRNYSQKQIDEISSGLFHFSCDKNIIDNNSLVQNITDLSLDRIASISKIYENEFSEVQIENREKKYSSGYLLNEEECLYLNLIKVKFPELLYIADVNINEQDTFNNINESRIKIGINPLKRFKNKDHLIKEHFKSNKIFTKDWIHREGKLYSFRDFHDSNNPYSYIIDKGTITPISCEEFYSKGEDYLRIFKNLLRNCLIEDCRHRELEWVGKKKIIRFKADRGNPVNKSVHWVGKKQSAKTVISRISNKKEDHIICFRHLAFEPLFEKLSNEWYLSIKPTWSFTNPSGFITSRFEESYLSGIKRLENNLTIYYFYRFWCYYLLYQDLFSYGNPILKFSIFNPLLFSPKIDDTKWLPVRIQQDQIEIKEAIVKVDSELTLNLFD